MKLDCFLKDKAKFLIKPLATCFAIYFVGTYSIIRANFNYLDDMGRVAEGFKRFNDWSRYLSSFLSNIIHMNSYLTDVSPLPQFIAMIILALAAIVMLYSLTERMEFGFWHYIAIIPIGLSPYFLECLSFKYDSPYMALSILASVIPLLFKKNKVWLYFIFIFLGTLAVCTTYQAACGIFPMIVIANSIRDWVKGEKLKRILIFIGISILGYGLSLCFFKFLLMKPVDAYVSNSVSVEKIGSNYLQYMNVLRCDFGKEIFIAIIVIAISFSIILTIKSERNKILTLILSFLSVLMMALMMFGVYPVLSEPLYAPRAMYGFGIFISIIGIIVADYSRLNIGKIALLFISWYFFVFSFSYGNMLYVQKQYTDYRITMVAEDLNEIDINLPNCERELQITGSIGYSPVIRNMPMKNSMPFRLIPITFNGGWLWGEYGLVTYYDLDNLKMNYGQDFVELDLPVLKDTLLYTIRGDDTHILIELRE